jgi:hypothetical protein
MLRHLKYAKAVRQLAGMARQKAMDRDALYHGTRFAELIRKTGVLFYSDPGDPKVSFTRSPEVAAYWALLERDYDEGRGSVFIFDRQSLERRYKVEANPEVYRLTNTLFHDEAEEAIWSNVIDIGNHLIGLVSGPKGWRSHKHKTLNRKYRARIEARLLLLERQMTFSTLIPTLCAGSCIPRIARRSVGSTPEAISDRGPDRTVRARPGAAKRLSTQARN